jgi:hypothetical protein
LKLMLMDASVAVIKHLILLLQSILYKLLHRILDKSNNHPTGILKFIQSI